MRKIAVFTGSRAEYGLLYWLMKEIEADTSCELQIIVSGMHCSPEFGETWRVIEQDGFEISSRVEMILSSDTPVGVLKSMGLGLISYAEELQRLKPNVMIVLGDRFEALAMVQSCLISNVPVAHLHGGEITQGAYDDAIRHAITKMSSVHFVATDCYRKRVIQMGEQPDLVFNVGALGLDHYSRTPRMNLDELSNALDFPLAQPYFLLTYHPVTVGNESPTDTTHSIISALDEFQDHQVIFTYPNADNGGREIISIMKAYGQKNPKRVLCIPSLGTRLYLSLLANAEAVIGNSSSAIIEAPAFKIPSINIGERQLGRLSATSVIHCKADFNSILNAIFVAKSAQFKVVCENSVNPYGQGDAAKKIHAILKGLVLSNRKEFYNME